jgi:mono/diheme cytochrome c family protein
VSPLKVTVNVVQFFAAAAALAFVVLLFVNEPDQADTSTGPGGAVDGSAVFSQNCAGCHGSGGEGGSGAKLNEGLVVANFPDPADQVEVVTNGRGPMPAFGDRLSPEEIEAVVEFTRTL